MSSELSQIFFANAPKWWSPKSGNLYDVYQGENKIKVGSCMFCIVNTQNTGDSPKRYFPDSWYVWKQEAKTNSVLEITSLETYSHKGQGSGRLILQTLYEKSVQCGCGGRIQVLATFPESVPFYEHCGFTGGKPGMPGLKFFDPTQENINRLFSREMADSRITLIPTQPKTLTRQTLARRRDESHQRQ